MPDQIKTEADQDMDRLAEHAEKCLVLMRARNKKYGSAWKKRTWKDISLICSMKLDRGAEQSVGEPDPKMIDEFMDVVNYSLMAIDILIQKHGQDPDKHL